MRIVARLVLATPRGRERSARQARWPGRKRVSPRYARPRLRWEVFQRERML
jgi:hypothetical protein